MNGNHLQVGIGSRDILSHYVSSLLMAHTFTFGWASIFVILLRCATMVHPQQSIIDMSDIKPSPFSVMLTASVTFNGMTRAWCFWMNKVECELEIKHLGFKIFTGGIMILGSYSGPGT